MIDNNDLHSEFLSYQCKRLNPIWMQDCTTTVVRPTILDKTIDYTLYNYLLDMCVPNKKISK